MILDLPNILGWWLILFLIGAITFPLTWLLFRKTFDLGYGVAKTVGLISASFIVFLLSSVKLLPLTRISFFFVLFVFLLFNLWILVKNQKDFYLAVSQKLKLLIFIEVLFFLGLLFWSYVRAHQPDIRGLEKFMDYGFINSILNSRFLPPIDMWASGETINYYWFGHLMTAFLTKLSGIPVAKTYNLMIGTILGLTFTSAFGICTSLISKSLDKVKPRVIIIGGLMSALLLGLGGNFHTPYFVLKNGVEKYWYPDATRFIGYNPDTNDKTIHEFPSYSYIVSDLHGHLLDLPVVLTFLFLLTNLIVFSKEKREKLLVTLGLGFLTGIMFMTNTWDFGIYLLISGVVIATANLFKHRFSLNFIFETSKSLFTIISVGLICALPFILNFTSIAEGISFVHARSPLWQLSILWGFCALLSATFFLYLLKNKKLDETKIFIISLIISGWILIFLPEVIFVKDIYIGSHHRANTMFKLTYQGFVIFYLISGYIISSFLVSINKPLLKFFGAVVASLFIASILIYPYFGIKSFYGELKTYRGLDGESWLKREYPGEYKAVLWFRENVRGQPTILEAAGDSYTDYNVVSSYSGLPTVSGWFVHEWLWRGTPEFPKVRSNDVNIIYMSKDLGLSKNLLSKYNVSYVILGTFERQKYPEVDEGKFEKIGRLVFSEEGMKIFEINYN